MLLLVLLALVIVCRGYVLYFLVLMILAGVLVFD